jgi:hypothetical protein
MRSLIAASILTQCFAQEIRLDVNQADEALALAANRSSFDRMASTEAYTRFKKREAEMGKPILDAEFKKFLTSPGLKSKANSLRSTLNDWKRADFKAIASRIRSYLPTEAKLNATVYIVVKPKTNSFVYELATNPAVFLYLDPTVSKAEFENTVAHELHHVGFASIQPSDTASSGKQLARRYTGAFGEGLAMLAAAGGPDIHPHLHSPAEVRARWDRDLQNVPKDLQAIEGFLLDTAAGKLTEAEQREKLMSFFGEQGPWYTVGWVMATTVEKAKGRPALVDCMKDLPRLLLLYNQTASDSQPKWSAQLLDTLSGS